MDQEQIGQQVELVYTKLKSLGYVTSQYGFSKDYLGRCRTYYSVLKAGRGKWQADVVGRLTKALDRDIAQLQSSPASKLSPAIGNAANELSLLCAGLVEARQNVSESGKKSRGKI